MGHFEPEELQLNSQLADLLGAWMDVLHQQQQQQQDQDQAFSHGALLALRPSQLIPPQQRQLWPAANVWSGLKVVLGLLEVRACTRGCPGHGLVPYCRVLIVVSHMSLGWVLESEMAVVEQSCMIWLGFVCVHVVMSLH